MKIFPKEGILIMPSALSLGDIFEDNHLEETIFFCMLSKSGQLEIWMYNTEGISGLEIQICCTCAYRS